MILNGFPWNRAEILSFLRLPRTAAFQILPLTVMATPFLLRDSCPQQWVLMVVGVTLTHSGPFSSPIPKMLIFTLASSCLTTFNFP